MNGDATGLQYEPPRQPSAAAREILEAVREKLRERRLPEATYRLQFQKDFSFRDARALVSYLASLGITDAYASPYLQARPQSTHGYDIVDHSALSAEIGTEAEHAAFSRELSARGMGQLLDFVPNHMGIAGNENAWWMDVLENGPSSAYASFFDIDWMPLKPDLANKVLLPVLGDQYGKVLEDQELVLFYEDGAFFVRYQDRRFPIATISSAAILRHRGAELEDRLGISHPHLLEYQSILTAIAHLPPRTETDPARLGERAREKAVIRRRLMDLCVASPEVREHLGRNVGEFNGRKGDPRSFDLLDQLLLAQPYRLAYWRVAADEINFRRFFDINELAAICMENPAVFEQAHALVLRLIAEGKVTGLRIDHPDGLYAPMEYLERLQEERFLQLAREVAGAALDRAELEAELKSVYRAGRRDPDLGRPLFLIVEKILSTGEHLCYDWPVFGTVGYECLNALNGIFVDRESEKAFDSIYARFIARRLPFPNVVYECKKLIMQVAMSSEVSVLGHQLDRISERNRWSRDFTLNSLTDAIREIIACFPVYRTYIAEGSIHEHDRRYVEQAVLEAKRRNPAISASIFDFVRDTLLLRDPDGADDEDREARRRFVGKFQQVTGPVMAKGAEDTAFYSYNRLVSLNEVGGDPETFGISVADFHRANQEQQARWPHALFPTSTHDSKRGEDVRARLNVLSEIPREWEAHVFRWGRWNRNQKVRIARLEAPSRNDEYLLYQTLVGTWPFEAPAGEARAAYVTRIREYMIKAAREAKAATSWVNPNEAYEAALSGFIEAILEESPRNHFLFDLLELVRRVADLGIWNSLSQQLLRLAAPGVPDVYQGTELWSFTLVDPDNRGPVDYRVREEALRNLKNRSADAGGDLTRLAGELVEARRDGRIKLYLIWRALEYRRAHPGLFTLGEYRPLEIRGKKREHACAFARKSADGMVLAIAPRLVAGLLGAHSGPPLGPKVWDDTWIYLPPELRLCNVLTGEAHDAAAGPSGSGLALADVFRTFPVALLERANGSGGP